MNSRQRITLTVCVLVVAGCFFAGYGVAALLTDNEEISGTFSTSDSPENPETTTTGTTDELSQNDSTSDDDLEASSENETSSTNTSTAPD